MAFQDRVGVSMAVAPVLEARVATLQEGLLVLFVLLVGLAVAYASAPVGECDRCPHCRNERVDKEKG